jgi:hypothetical protein
LEREIRVVTMHEGGEVSSVIAIRLGVSIRYVEKTLAKRGFRNNATEAVYLRTDRRLGKAGSRTGQGRKGAVSAA